MRRVWDSQVIYLRCIFRRAKCPVCSRPGCFRSSLVSIGNNSDTCDTRVSLHRMHAVGRSSDVFFFSSIVTYRPRGQAREGRSWRVRRPIESDTRSFLIGRQRPPATVDSVPSNERTAAQTHRYIDGTVFITVYYRSTNHRASFCAALYIVFYARGQGPKSLTNTLDRALSFSFKCLLFSLSLHHRILRSHTKTTEARTLKNNR